MMSKKTKLNRIKKGICFSCGKEPAKSNCSKCITCLERCNQNGKRLKNKRKALGLCTRCGKLAYNNTLLCKKCSKKASEYTKKRKEKLRKLGICIACETQKTSHRLCSGCYLKKDKARKKLSNKIKTEIFQKYGYKCNCCGEAQKEFLTIDHIDGNGGELRKSGKHSRGNTFYKWIIENNFPDSLQILCRNCNWAKWYSGVNICPHKLNKK